MSPTRSLPLLSLVLSLAAGCDDAEKPADTGGEPTDGGDDGGTDGGGGDGETDGGEDDGGDDGSTEATRLEVVDVQPPSLVGLDGGRLTITAQVVGSGEACREACTLLVVVDGEELPLELAHETDGSGTVSLTTEVPGGLLPSGAGQVRVLDGTTEVATLPLRLREAGALAALAPLAEAPTLSQPDVASGWSPISSITHALEDLAGGLRLAGLSTCCVLLDDDFIYEIEAGHVVVDDYDGFDTLAFHTSAGSALGELVDPTVVDDYDITFALESEVFASGPGDAHYGHITVRRTGADDSLVAVVAHPGRVEAFQLQVAADGTTTAAALDLGLRADDMPDRLVDIAPLELSDGTLTLGVLGLVEVDAGKWSGTWFDGRKTYAWDALGGVSATELATGAAFGGLVHTGPVRAAVSPGSQQFWSFDPDDVEVDCVGAVGLFTIGSSVTQTRTVKVQDRDDAGKCSTLSSPGAVAAVALDADSDGSDDLVVQIFGQDAAGEATESSHLLPRVADASARHAGVRLDPALPAPGYRPAALATPSDSSGDGAESSAAMEADGGDKPWLSLSGIRFLTATDLDVPPSSWQSVRNLWSTDDLVTAVALAERGPATATATTGGVVAQSTPSTPPASDCRGLGVCLNGTCACLPGLSGRDLTIGSGAGTADASELSLASGERVWLADHSGARVAHRVTAGATLASRIVLAHAATADAAASIAVDTATGSTVWTHTGADPVDLGGVDRAKVVVPDADTGGLVGFYSFDDAHTLDAGDAGDSGARPRRLGVVLADGTRTGAQGLTLPPETARDGTTPPELLGAAVDGGGMLFWRDGEGQAWLGVLDMAEAAGLDDGPAPFRAGPMTVGGPSPDLPTMLQITPDRPLAVGFRAGAPAAPVLAETAEARAIRYADWTPVEGAAEVSLSGWTARVVVDLRSAPSGPSASDDAVCSLASLTIPLDAIGSDTWEASTWVDRATDDRCADLRLPLAAAPFLADGRDAVFELDGHGTASLSTVLDEGEAATLAVENPIFTSGGEASTNVLASCSAGSGDADGDGIPELWVRAWGRAGLQIGGLATGAFTPLHGPRQVDALDGIGATRAPTLGDSLRPQPLAEPLSSVADLRD